MKILVANLGSTSFKYRLFDMADERVLARGGVERIGSPQSRCFVEAGGAARGDDRRGAGPRRRGAAVPATSWPTRSGSVCKDPSELAAIGFKAVHAQGPDRRAARRRAACWRRWKRIADVAPAHNPPYIKAMRLLSRELPEIPLVAAFETGFHETIPPAERLLRGAAGVGDEARHPALGLSRRQPSLHRRAHGRAAEEAGREDHLVPPGRQQFAVRDSKTASRWRAAWA